MTTRLFFYPTEKSAKPTLVLECKEVSAAKATVPAHISIESVKPGMVCCPGEGRHADRSKMYVVAEAQAKKIGLSTIIFEKEAPPAPPGSLEPVKS